MTRAKHGKADLPEMPLKRAEKSDFKPFGGGEKILKNHFYHKKLLLLLIYLLATDVSNLQ